VHLKDVLDEVLDEAAGPDTVVPTSDIRPLPIVPLSTPLAEALAGLRRASSHLGAVTDADGVVIGIVALEDLLEEYVGTVRDGTHRGTDAVPGQRNS
jgi:CBS domain containing-hemolysin-like protein